ncbi:MAG: tRNA (N6-isopentenyl adenosine(37)-C2)-methylthiotransferase MiaB [Elusimicrobia bacterium]|nr:tRNA (N6-isopentenyl adenosine(37)-C2)-methylthiotransferase MiaB [Elusimicrobiota bacterium]
MVFKSVKKARKTMKFYIKTFGCQMNESDSGIFAAFLEQSGYLPTDNIDEADIAIVNTCSVRQHAEERAFTEIGDLKHFKANNPNGKVIVVGCMAERMGKELKQKFPQIDLLIGAKDAQRFPEIIKKSGLLNPLLNDPVKQAQITPVSTFTTITRGCNNFCSYCVVPYVRGPEEYRPAEEIIKEIKELAEKGLKEVTLLGQNVNSYRSVMSVPDPKNEGSFSIKEIDFADLLTELNKLVGIKRIRFMTNHPKDVSDKFIKTICTLNKVCNHIHLPLQSGSDRILELMNRKYTFDYYYGLIRKLRYHFSEISITTDLMVGFPKENDKDFKLTLEAVNKIKFDFAYVFKYSPRENTEAFKLKDDVPKETKEKRHKELLDLCNETAREKNSKFVGNLAEVLVESGTGDEYTGKTKDNRAVTFHSARNLIGQPINIKIKEAKIHSLIGEPVVL